MEISDGFKVDKDCLDLELTPEKVFIAQKYMTEKANMANKLVITSTEMFQSMEAGAKPTRAEISMVSNAVLDGADYIMLSCETSQSENAVEAIKILSSCCIEAEKLMDFRVEHLRQTSVADLTEETYEYLVQQSKDQGTEDEKDWL